MINISAHYAHLVHPFISKDETSYYLGGFYVEAAPQGGAFIVATNGHVMVIFHDISAWLTEPCIVKLNKGFVAQCRTPLSEKDGDRRLEVVDGTATLMFDESPIAMQPGALVEATYPDWCRVVPQTIEASAQPSVFDMKLLADFKTILNTHGKISPVKIFNSSDQKGAAVILSERKDFIGVVMPLKANLISDQEFPFDIRASKELSE